MKKICLILAFLLVPSGLFAQEAIEVRDMVIMELQRFYDTEKGNIITEYNIAGLATRIAKLVEDYEKQKKKKAPEVPK